MSITEIKQAITQLSEKELTELVSWLDEYQRQKCDVQIKVDGSLSVGEAFVPRIGNLNPGSISISEDFDKPLSDIS